MKKSIFCILMFMFTIGVAWGEAVTFQATINASRVSLDEVLQLTLTVAGASDNLDPVSLPVMDGFTSPNSPNCFISKIAREGSCFILLIF